MPYSFTSLNDIMCNCMASHLPQKSNVMCPHKYYVECQILQLYTNFVVYINKDIIRHKKPWNHKIWFPCLMTFQVIFIRSMSGIWFIIQMHFIEPIVRVNYQSHFHFHCFYTGKKKSQHFPPRQKGKRQKAKGKRHSCTQHSRRVFVAIKKVNMESRCKSSSESYIV